MIKSFKHKGLERFYLTDSKAGIIPSHSAKLRNLLYALEVAHGPEDMDFAGWRLHPLQGILKGHWSVKVNGNWRMTFRSMARMPKLSIIRITTEEELWRCSIRRIRAAWSGPLWASR